VGRSRTAWGSSAHSVVAGAGRPASGRTARSRPDAANTPVGYIDPNDGRPYRLIQSEECNIWGFFPRSGIFLDTVPGVAQPTPFLELTSKDVYGGERGLLSLALDPDYRTTGELYVYYTRANADTSLRGDVVVERYTRDGADADLADPASAETILVVEEPASNHNGGTLAFGPDGMLYISLGDGGDGCDSLGPYGQDLTSLLGKVLRIDVRGVSAESSAPECGIETANYGIPPLMPLANPVSLGPRILRADTRRLTGALERVLAADDPMHESARAFTGSA